MVRLLFLLLPFLAGHSVPDTLSYDVRYKLGTLDTRVVTAKLTWNDTEWNGIPAYYSTVVLRPTPFFRLFLSKNYFAETYFSQHEPKPLFFANPFKKNGKEGRHEYVYGRDTIASTSVLETGQVVHASFPNDGRTVDFLSLVHYLRFLDLSQTREPLPLHILISGKLYPAELRYLGQDLEKYPDAPADKFLLLFTERGLMENGSGKEVYLWRSMAPDHTLLGLETRLSTGSMSVGITPPKKSDDEN